MKKIITVVFTLLLVGFSSKQSAAQFSSAGVGLMYGTEIGQPGLRLDGVYTIDQVYRVTADIGIFFPDKTNYGGGAHFKVTWWEINANGNYIFHSDPAQTFLAYALGGLNFLTVKQSLETVGEDNYDSEIEVGLNIGAGFEYALDFANLFGEAKYVLRTSDQLTFGIGLRFPFDP